jgi:hypothetical protein
MARIALLCPDLLFGSRVEGGLRAAGHEVERLDGVEAARPAVVRADVLVVDLTDAAEERTALVAALRASGELDGARTLGFYAHVEHEVRVAAEEAGFDLVVPRSRMAREMAALVARLAPAASPAARTTGSGTAANHPGRRQRSAP